MLFKKLFRLTKIRLLFALGLFSILGFWKIFNMQSSVTGEIYVVSLFNRYGFYYQHFNDSWYSKGDKFFWPYIISLHLLASYVLICVSSFIVNRLWGRD